MKQQNICQYSGEKTNGRKVILLKYVVDYVRKMNYIVSNKPMFLLLAFAFLFFVPVVSAYSSQYSFDLDSRINMIISVCFLVGASVLSFIPRARLLGAFLFVIIGILFLFNGLNSILAFSIIGVGVIVVFLK